jgi:ABC-type lipoprotein release transport system permease subunit
MNIFAFAFRNVIRSRQRAWVTIGAMAFAGAIMIFYAALLEGMLRATEKNAVGMELGEFQIHAPGFRNDPDLYKRIENEAELLDKLEKEGYRAAPRLLGVGLVAVGVSSAGVVLRGVDIARESSVTELHRHLLAGLWLDEADPNGVVIGRKLARTLDTGLGGELVLVGQAADGSMANDLYTVRGILKSVGDGIDRGGFFMTATAFREVMVLPSGVHEIVVRGDKRETDIGEQTGRLAAMAPDIEVKNWRDLQPVLARIVDMSRVSLIIMLMITYVAVGILTLNGMLMSVFERIREFGVMKALGVSPWNVFALIVVEAMLQVTTAAILAMAAAVPLSLYCQTHPLDLSGLAKTSSTIAGIAIDPFWYSKVTFDSIALPVLFLYLTAVLAILYPAGKAALIRPVRAIHHR